MQKIILDISNSFMTEALSSPRMLEDLAAMERYMSESYDGRTFVELLQNADDANSQRVKVFVIDDTLVVANDGRPFNKSDIMAICRSGASSKQRGSNIGYRGVGFKSATTISTEIVIYSADTYFTFSKSICAQHLQKSADAVPTVRIPFLYDRDKLTFGVSSAIDACKKDGYTTFFIFLNARIDKFLHELEGFDVGWLLFLKRISEVTVECGSFKKKCSIKRKSISETDILLSVSGIKNQWYVISRDNISIAFKYDSVEGVLPCGTDEAVFHCFLPTLDKTGFPFKVNADFSTDPSRKHIIQDESTNKALCNIQQLFSDVICRIVRDENEKLYPILSLLNTHTTLNSLVTQFENGLLEKLRTREWVPLNNGQFVKPNSAKILPKWLNDSERNQILTNVSYIAAKTVKLKLVEKTEKVSVLLNKLGTPEITIRELSDIIMNADHVQHIPAELLGKMFVYCYRAISLDERLVRNLFVPLAKGYIPLSETSSDTELNAEFVAVVKSLLTAKETDTLSISYEVFSVLQKKKGNIPTLLKKPETLPEDTSAKASRLAINKWKTPVQNCVAVETLNGNTAKDVGKKCDEYSVISTDAEGKISYIAVKTVGILGDSFKLTESEYSAAQRLGDNYKVYLFTTDTSNIKYTVVVNPVDTTHMRKVVKEWEWLCDSYESDGSATEHDEAKFEVVTSENEGNFEFDKMDGGQFERFCAQLLMKNGYEDVALTKTSGDQGIDIIAYRDGIKYGIQCKCYSSDIGNSAVQEVFAGKTFYKCNIGIVLTNQHFSSSAIQLAENNGVVLWGREALLKLIKNAK